MFQHVNNRLGHYLLLLSVSASLFLLNLGGPSLWDIDEGRNATAAEEMYDSNDWIRPTFNGQLRSHKPVLIYWLQATAYHFFGINEFSARLPSALAAMLTVLLAYELGRHMFNPATGLLGALILASSTLFCASAHFANPDALLLTFATATLVAFWLGFSTGRAGWWAATGITSGLAMLAKGPVGLVLPAAVIWLFLIWSGHWRMLLHRAWIKAALLWILVAMPWYVLITLDTKGEFLADFFGTHNLDRALNPMENHSGPPWYYLAVLAIGLVPWSIFLLPAIWYGRPHRSHHAAGDDSVHTDGQPHHAERDDYDMPYRFLWCWIAVFFVAFTLAATKLPNYILPVFPPFALLTARFLDRWRRGEIDAPVWLQPVSLAVLALIGMATIGGLLIVGGVVEVSPLHGRAWPGVEQWSILGAVPIAGAAVAGWCLYRRQRSAFVAVLATAALAFLVPLAAGASAALNNFRAPKPLVEQAGALQRDHDIRIGCFNLEFLPSLNFYVQRNVVHHKTAQDALDFLRCEGQTVFLFLPKSDWEQLAPLFPAACRVVAANREMYRAGEVVVVTNH